MGGTFVVHANQHSFLEGKSREIIPPHLPSGKLSPKDVEFRHVHEDGTPLAGVPYTMTLADGSIKKGITDEQGFGIERNIPKGGVVKITYGHTKTTPKAQINGEIDEDLDKLFSM